MINDFDLFFTINGLMSFFPTSIMCAIEIYSSSNIFSNISTLYYELRWYIEGDVLFTDMFEGILRFKGSRIFIFQRFLYICGA